MSWWELRKNQGKSYEIRKSQGKIREFDGIKKWEPWGILVVQLRHSKTTFKYHITDIEMHVSHCRRISSDVQLLSRAARWQSDHRKYGNHWRCASVQQDIWWQCNESQSAEKRTWWLVFPDLYSQRAMKESTWCVSLIRRLYSEKIQRGSHWSQYHIAASSEGPADYIRRNGLDTGRPSPWCGCSWWPCNSDLMVSPQHSHFQP